MRYPKVNKKQDEIPTLDDVKLPPHRVEVEQTLLGGVFYESSANPLMPVTKKMCTLLKPKDFYRTPHRYIFEAIQFLIEMNEVTDIITVGETLSDYGLLEASGGRPYLMDLAMSTTHFEYNQMEYYSKMLKNDSMLRDLIYAGNELVENAYNFIDANHVLSKIQAEIIKIAENKYSKTVDNRAVKSVNEIVDRIERQRAGEKTPMGTATGWEELDLITRGWQEKNLIIVAARPSMGKSAMALNTAYHSAVVLKKPTIIFTMEMSGEELMQRMLSSMTAVDSFDLKAGIVSDDQFKAIVRARKMIKESPLFIEENSTITPGEMKVKINEIEMKHGKIGLVVVDYLQLMSMEGFKSGDNRTQEISNISRNLKGIAKDGSFPLIALSQLSRACESRDDKRPLLSDLRESGSIEQDADVVMVIYRDEYYNPTDANKGKAEFIIRKQRQGPLATVNLNFLPKMTEFRGKNPKVYYCNAD